jgi:TPR repeat protein
MRGQRRQQASALPCIAFFTCLLLGRAASNAVAAPPTNDRLDMLLAKVEQQLAAGHATVPSDDNALDTWLQVLSSNLSETPASLTAIQSFASDLRGRAATAKADEKLTLSADYAVFADMADHYLAKANGTQSGARPVTAVSEPGPPPVVATPNAESLPPPAEAPDVTVARAPSEEPSPDRKSGAQGSPSALAPPGKVVTHQEARPNAPPPPNISQSVGDMSAQQADLGTSLRSTEAPAVVDPQKKTAGAPEPLVHQDPAAAALYSARGDAMIAIRDISAARKLYELAANAGSARAASALGKTYDPAGLRQLGAIGLRPNPGLAALWYRRAEAMGDPDAEARLNSLAYEAPR